MLNHYPASTFGFYLTALHKAKKDMMNLFAAFTFSLFAHASILVPSMIQLDMF